MDDWLTKNGPEAKPQDWVFLGGSSWRHVPSGLVWIIHATTMTFSRDELSAPAADDRRNVTSEEQPRD